MYTRYLYRKILKGVLLQNYQLVCECRLYDVLYCLLLLSDWSFAVSSCAVIGQVLAELRFSVHQLLEEDTSVQFKLQMVRYIFTSETLNTQT